ncbi:hypothetical protein EI94DRAFT_1713463, partial [Lactarius quietus]
IRTSPPHEHVILNGVGADVITNCQQGNTARIRMASALARLPLPHSFREFANRMLRQLRPTSGIHHAIPEWARSLLAVLRFLSR